MDLTHNFTPGTRAVAQQVNQNFADVKSAVDPLQTDVADIKTQLTSGIVLPDGSVDFTRLQSYKTYVVSNATNATPIVVTAVAHDFITGDKVYISGVGGNTAANGLFTITKIGTDTFSLDGSVGNGAFSSNGSAIIYPSADKNLTSKSYVDNGDLNNITQIGTCSTVSATAEKAVVLSGFVLATGVTLLVSCSNANTAATPTLNINSTGAKALKFKDGIAVDATHPAPINLANRKMLVTYDGTDYIIQENSVYVSAETAINLSSLTMLNHGLGGMPRKAQVFIKCITAEGGYSIGDVIIPISYATEYYDRNGLIFNSTQIGYRPGNGAYTQIGIINKSDGSHFPITAANWVYIFIASI